MLKRTTGRLLLALLVITGLAGTLNNSSLSQKERKQAISVIKSSKLQVLNCVNGLSEQQLNFKPSQHDPSIQELVMDMVSLEKRCSDNIKTSMEKPANSEDRLKITLSDEQLLEKNNYKICQAGTIEHAKTIWKNPAEAMKKFAVLRTNHIKYIRTSTEDLRNHVVSTPEGWIDCYQYYLLLADRSSYIAERINQVKSSPSFPKK